MRQLPTPKKAREAFDTMRFLARWDAVGNRADEAGSALLEALDAYREAYPDHFTDPEKP